MTEHDDVQHRQTFQASGDAANDKGSMGDFRGEEVDLTLTQEWDDQTVYAVGGAFKATPALTLRAGISIADNPIPADYVNPLFPAIIEDHVTGGLSYALTERSKVGAAAVYAPEVEVTNPRTGVTARHSQINGRLNYVYRF